MCTGQWFGFHGTLYENWTYVVRMSNERLRSLFRTDLAVMCGFATLILVVHGWLGNGYGFHRDELQFLDDARHLHWGFVAYPPLTALCGRVAIALFGISPQVFRLPAALADAVSLVLVGLIARELGGRRAAQLLAMAAAFPVALGFSSVLQYNTFDLLAWCVVVLFGTRVLRTQDARNWVGVGVGVGIGVLSKYSIAFLVLSLLVGIVALPSQRRWLRSRWFWYGALIALVIAAPNLIWLASHHFITLRMESSIHARDVRLGRADGFYTDQIKFTLFAFPLALAGLVSLLRSARFRLLSFCYVGPFILLVAAQGRGYYLLPAYMVLYAAGAVWLMRVLVGRPQWVRAVVSTAVACGMLLDVAAVGWVYLPVWRVGSVGWNWQMKNNADLANEVGWPEFVEQVAAVRDQLPPSERNRLAVLANNFGEAGALELYGPRFGLPAPISSTNSFHARGYGAYEPQTVIVVGSTLEDQLKNFRTCTVVAGVWLPYGVHNEETEYHPDILVCRDLRGAWPEVWSRSQEFG
jgi:4-amino-4-deoxy-L-arabinose transferase-like glycosyltransferase